MTPPTKPQLPLTSFSIASRVSSVVLRTVSSSGFSNVCVMSFGLTASTLEWMMRDSLWPWRASRSYRSLPVSSTCSVSGCDSASSCDSGGVRRQTQTKNSKSLHCHEVCPCLAETGPYEFPGTHRRLPSPREHEAPTRSLRAGRTAEFRPFVFAWPGFSYFFDYTQPAEQTTVPMPARRPGRRHHTRTQTQSRSAWVSAAVWARSGKSTLRPLFLRSEGGHYYYSN